MNATPVQIATTGSDGAAGDDLRKRLASALDWLGRACGDADLTPEQRNRCAQMQALLRELDAELADARQRYDTLFNAVPDPVSIIDEGGHVLDLNKAGMNAYRRAREEIVGKLIHVINPDLPRDHMGPVWDVLNRGETCVVEVTNMRGDGTRFPVEVHSAMFLDRGEKRIVAVARDLTGRREAETRLSELMEAIDKGILVQDAEGRILSGNPAAHRILGVEEGKGLAELVSLEDWLVFDERGARLRLQDMPPMRALREGRIVESTLLGLYHLRRRQLTWLSVTSVPQFPSGADHPQQVISLFSDVTALKRDSALFDRAQALARIGGWEWDIGRGRLYLTDEAARILGCSTAPPTTFDELLAPLRQFDQLQLQRAMRELQQRGGGFDLEAMGERPDGSTVWVRLIGEPEHEGPVAARVTGTLQDITERKQAEEVLRLQARTDPLTDLLNRDGALAELVGRIASPVGRGAAVLYIDLDRFKVVNDVLGHSAGDQLLITAARRLEQAVAGEGLLARLGGDEFLVLIDTDDDPQRPERLAESITRAFGDGFRYAGEEFSITASVGIARHPADGASAQLLLKNADAAMYDAKRRGRNTWQVFSPDLARRQQDRLQVETQLRRALDNDEFRLVYQPQVDLASGRMVAVEALIRWQNRTLGEMRPDRFISHAETTGDIVRIGAWVLREACRQSADWRAAGVQIGRIAVNVSYRQFLSEDLADIVARALEEFELPPEALELEFTERVLIEDAPDTHKTFAALQELGVILTIDDFGEGYSALNYLRRLPIHGLKLSQAFLQGVPHNRSDVAICQAVTGIARSLGLGVVAEGIESEAQRAFLLDLGANIGQGYLFSPGLPPNELETYARRRTPLIAALRR